MYYKACERFSRFACAKAAVNLVLQILMPGQGKGQQQQQATHWEREGPRSPNGCQGRQALGAVL